MCEGWFGDRERASSLVLVEAEEVRHRFGIENAVSCRGCLLHADRRQMKELVQDLRGHRSTTRCWPSSSRPSRVSAFRNLAVRISSARAIIEAFGDFVLEPRGLLAARDRRSSEALFEISRMISESPSLFAREQQIPARYTDSLAELIRTDTGAARNDPRPGVVAAALIGVHRSLINHVRRHILAGERDLARTARSATTASREALALLGSGLHDYRRVDFAGEIDVRTSRRETWRIASKERLDLISRRSSTRPRQPVRPGDGRRISAFSRHP